MKTTFPAETPTAASIIADAAVSNEDQMKVYRERSTRAMQEHGMEVMARGGGLHVLEGDWAPKPVAVLKFADRAAARAYCRSATYTTARRAPEGAGSINMIVVDGV